jgi:hypothetical protein
MKYPSGKQWAEFFRRLPVWIVVLIVVLLYGRLVMLALWHWLVG